MSPVVTLSESTDAKLKLLITRPFEDTRESLITALIDAELYRKGISPNGSGLAGTVKDNTLQLDPDSHENLTHTRLISATVDGRPIHRPKWNSVLEYLHVLGYKRLGSFEELDRLSGAKIREGRYEQDGYKYVSEADLSIQGVDANSAWARSLGLAREIGVAIEIKFEWRQKEGAARRGEIAILRWDKTSPKRPTIEPIRSRMHMTTVIS